MSDHRNSSCKPLVKHKYYKSVVTLIFFGFISDATCMLKDRLLARLLSSPNVPRRGLCDTSKRDESSDDSGILLNDEVILSKRPPFNPPSSAVFHQESQHVLCESHP
jgi:hypothetical protein